LVANGFTEIQPDSENHMANTEWYTVLLRYFDPQNMLGYFTAATNSDNTCVRVEPAATKRKRTQVDILRRNLFSDRTMKSKNYARLSWEIRNWNLQVDKKEKQIATLQAQITKLENEQSDMKVKKTNNALMLMNLMDGPLNIRPNIVEYSDQGLTVDRKRVLNNCALW
jgi:septal ring factor EnvC (AmiA/AmiB activator)